MAGDIKVRIGDPAVQPQEGGRENSGLISLEGVSEGTLQKLRAKLEQYRAREKGGNERLQMDTIFKKNILEILLKDEEVLEGALKEHLFRQYGSDPQNEILFKNAFAVIKNYVEASGVDVRRGGGF